jgi:hypothetical protein
MKTAVEWYNEEINKLNVGNDARVFIAKLFEQAKEIEKEQIIKSYKHGQNNGYMYRDGNSNIIQAQQYYNETFKSE